MRFRDSSTRFAGEVIAVARLVSILDSGLRVGAHVLRQLLREQLAVFSEDAHRRQAAHRGTDSFRSASEHACEPLLLGQGVGCGGSTRKLGSRGATVRVLVAELAAHIVPVSCPTLAR